MNFSLLDKIETVHDGILATILHTEGHTYKKSGAHALFAAGTPAPVWGNLGSACVDQELVRQGGEALAAGVPRIIRIDTSESEDADFGYGTYCGGVIEILVEPLFDRHKAVYRDVRGRLASRAPVWLTHDLATGELNIHAGEPAPSEGLHVEEVPPLRPVFIFGATPLAKCLLRTFKDMEFDLHVIDWRSDYLDGFAGIAGVTTHTGEAPLADDAFVLIVSHHYHRDRAMLARALSKNCAFVGMLSSRVRRDRMFEELRKEGVAEDDLSRVVSPIGIDIGAKSDAEIAIAVAAQLVGKGRR
jgi:xanthine dehydrogenase accessory factor